MIPQYLDQYVHGEVREPGADVNLETRYLHLIINETNLPVCEQVSLTFEKMAFILHLALKNANWLKL